MGGEGGRRSTFYSTIRLLGGGGTYFQNCACDIEPFLIFLPGNFKNTLDYWAKKLKKCPVLYTQYKENSLFCHFLLQITPTAERFSNVLKFYNFKNILDTRLSSTKVKIVAHKVSAIWANTSCFGHFWCKNTLYYRAKSQKSARC